MKTSESQVSKLAWGMVKQRTLYLADQASRRKAEATGTLVLHLECLQIQPVLKVQNKKGRMLCLPLLD